MRARPSIVALGLVTVQVALFWGTSYLPGLGVAIWHHAASLAFTLAMAAALWRPFTRSRRFLALGIMSFSIVAMVSGFWLLYWKEGIRVAGYQDWGVFWHVLWSWIAAVFFLMHTWINRKTFALFFRRSFASLGPGLAHGGAYALLAVVFIITWLTQGREWFTNPNYIPLSLYTWLVFVVPAYVLWAGIQTLRRQARPPRWVDRFGHWSVRRWVDLALVPIAILVVASGVVLTFFDGVMEIYGWKYVSKYWHVWPSVAFSVLAFTHGAQAWGAVRAHWRSYAQHPKEAAARARKDATGGAEPSYRPDNPLI